MNFATWSVLLAFVYGNTSNLIVLNLSKMAIFLFSFLASISPSVRFSLLAMCPCPCSSTVIFHSMAHSFQPRRNNRPTYFYPPEKSLKRPYPSKGFQRNFLSRAKSLRVMSRKRTKELDAEKLFVEMSVRKTTADEKAVLYMLFE